MKKQISKKILTLFFVIAILTQVSSVKAMLNVYKRPAISRTVLPAIPDDCLCEIFQFFSDKPKELCLLRSVCKDFNQLMETAGTRLSVHLTIHGNNQDKIPYSNFPFSITKLTVKQVQEQLLQKMSNTNLLQKLRKLRIIDCDFDGNEIKKLKEKGCKAEVIYQCQFCRENYADVKKCKKHERLLHRKYVKNRPLVENGGEADCVENAFVEGAPVVGKNAKVGTIRNVVCVGVNFDDLDNFLQQVKKKKKK